MMWKKVKLGDVAVISSGNSAPQGDEFFINGIFPFCRTSDVGAVHLSTDLTEIKDKLNDTGIKGLTLFKKGTILIPKSGASTFLNHRAILGLDSYVSSHLATIQTNENFLFNLWAYYFFVTLDAKMLSPDTNYPTLKLSTISNIEIPLPAMEEQKKIAARLDAVSDLLAKQKQLLSEQDTLIQSTFYDMFGDPIKNEKGWNSKKLSELGSLKNGINFQKNDNESDLYCLGVADFKDNKYISDISALQKVPSKSVNLTEDLLKNGDIVFVRSNGNKALVGRCVAVYPNEEAVTFSGFCIRFRKSTTLIKTDYLLYFLKTPQVRNVLAGRGANIQNLNQQILSRVNILCPPLELQRKFAAVAEQIESEKSKIKSAIAETQTLFNALMSEYFEE